jgi:hypothetical protein
MRKNPKEMFDLSKIHVRVLARIIFKRTKKHVATTMTRRLGEIFLVKCQKQAKVYCYAFLHVLNFLGTNFPEQQIFLGTKDFPRYAYSGDRVPAPFSRLK